ncbi:arylsulfatase [Pontibacter sp. SGAir0037]|uniref:arylsulfatase n=1 Tax=Pontibacter sp. SGAir0037 TaxID=2571030 RepID=UPI00143CCA7B|nr:arylsulfatase [Pontibacter sp. SGAir0037]
MALILSCGSAKNTAANKDAEQPNIVLILADDMGFSDLGSYGGEIGTPSIDRLAKEGIRFTRMYNNAWCSPSRASLLTGLYPQQAGMGVLAEPKPGPAGPYQGYLNEYCVTLAEVLKSAGYTTALSGKWHLGDSQPYWPTNRGFEHYFGLISGASNYFDITKTKSPITTRKMALNDQPYTPPTEGFYMTDAITADAVKTLEEQKNEQKPFFLYVAYTAPHWPLHALPEDIAKYKDKYLGGWDSLRVQRYNRQKSMNLFGAETELSLRDEEVEAWDKLTQKQKEEMAEKMAIYAAQIDRMDQGIGQILEKLDAIEKKENTIVIFLSDNGGCAEGDIWGFDRRDNGLPPGGVDSYMSYGQSWANASNTPFRYYKKSLLEGGILTPLLIRWPAGIQKERQGQITNQVAHLVDVMPTLCELAGATYPLTYNGKRIHPMEGQSLVPQMLHGKTVARKPLYWALQERKAMQLDNYKLVAASNSAPWELYNLDQDRVEQYDLAASQPDKVAEMAALWKVWAERVEVFKEQPQNTGE